MTSISKSEALKRDERRKTFRPGSSFCLAGRWTTRTVLTEGARVRERVLRRKGRARFERSLRNRDLEPRCPLLPEGRKRAAVAHEEEKANDLRASPVPAGSPVSWTAGESRGLGRTQIRRR